MKNRILLIVESMFPLGPAQQLNVLARELVRRDYEVHIAILTDLPAEGFRLPSNCHIHHLEIQKRDWLAWQKLRRLAELVQPDVCHDFSAEWITRSAIGDRFLQVSSQYKVPSQPSPANWLRHKLVSRKAIAPIQFVATHPVLTDGLRESGIDARNMRIIPPAVDRELNRKPNARQFILNEYGLDRDSVLVGTFAPLIPATRIKDLIWAIDLITCIRDDVQLLVIGKGGQLNRLKRFLRCTAAPSHVHFVGCPVRSLEVLSGLDVYWNSHLQWPLPTAMLNAMQFGVPAISVLGRETKKVIQHQATGLGVNLGARDEFARWTKYLIEQVESASQLSEQGRLHVGKQFSTEAFVQAYVDLYSAMQA